MQLTKEVLDLARSTLTIPNKILENPILIQMVGLPCSGKSYLAKKIAESAPVVIICADHIRKTLFPNAEHSTEETRFLNDEVIEALMRELAEQKHSFLLDLNVDLKIYRKKNRELAKLWGMREATVVVRCSDKVAKRRLEERRKNPWRLAQSKEYVVPAEAYDMYRKKIELPSLFESHFTFNSEKTEDKKFQKLINHLKS